MAGLSPDGRFVSFLSTDEGGVPNVFLQPVQEGPPAPEPYPVTFQHERGVHSYSWTFLPGVLLYTQDHGGDENWRLYMLDITMNKTTVLSSSENVSAEIHSISHEMNEIILVGLNERDLRFHDIYRINLLTGEQELVFENDGYKAIIVDNALEIRLAARDTNEGGTEYVKPERDHSGNIRSWVTYRMVSLADDYSTKITGFTKDNQQIYWSESTGVDRRGVPRDLAALVIKDFDDPYGPGELIYEPKRSDIQGVLFHPTELSPIGVKEEFLMPVFFVIDKEFKQDFHAMFLANPERSLHILGVSQDLSVWLLTYSTDNAPSQYYIYHRYAIAPKEHFEYLFTVKEEYLKYNLSHVTPVEIRTRDNMTEVCYLGLPVDADPSGLGIPNRPLPLVVDVHGGPWERDSFIFDSEMQHMTNRGYAVIRCNYRGSTGYGKRFFTASFGEWAGAMHNDILDAVDWAVRRRIADPAKVGIVGASYGGYEVLVALSFTPSVFACGVDVVGPSNLITLLHSIPPYWRPLWNSFVTRIGASPNDPAGLTYLTDRSPLFHASSIRRPLLIAQGANDPRVAKAESDQIVAQLKNNRIPVSYILFPDEGHGFARPANQEAYRAVMEHFLADCLGGRKEDINTELTDSSIQIVEMGSLNLTKADNGTSTGNSTGL